MDFEKKKTFFSLKNQESYDLICNFKNLSLKVRIHPKESSDYLVFENPLRNG